MMTITIITLTVLIQTSFALEGGVTTSKKGKQIMYPDIEKIVNNVKEISKKYLVTRDEAKRKKKFISEEKKGTTYLTRIFDDNISSEVALIYHSHRNTVAEAVIDEKSGNVKYIYYRENGEIYSYLETRNGKAHGVYLFFYDNGYLAAFAEFKDNKYSGREMEWDEAGKIIRSQMNDGTRESLK